MTTHWTNNNEIANSSSTTTTTSTTTSGHGVHPFEIGSPLFYIMVGAGSGMLILLLIILTMDVAISCLAARKVRSYTLTTAPLQEQQSYVEIRYREPFEQTARASAPR